MQLIISSVENAYVYIKDTKEKRQIGKGILVYICISKKDEYLIKSKLDNNIDKLIQRLSNLQIIEKNGKISTSIKKENLELLLIPNFTLCGENKKGNKFDFNYAGSFEFSKTIFDNINKKLLENNIQAKFGIFGASMLVGSVNLGPLNYILKI